MSRRDRQFAFDLTLVAILLAAAAMLFARLARGQELPLVPVRIPTEQQAVRYGGYGQPAVCQGPYCQAGPAVRVVPSQTPKSPVQKGSVYVPDLSRLRTRLEQLENRLAAIDLEQLRTDSQAHTSAIAALAEIVDEVGATANQLEERLNQASRAAEDVYAAVEGQTQQAADQASEQARGVVVEEIARLRGELKARLTANQGEPGHGAATESLRPDNASGWDIARWAGMAAAGAAGLSLPWWCVLAFRALGMLSRRRHASALTPSAEAGAQEAPARPFPGDC